MKLETDKWSPFLLSSLFTLKKGKRLTKSNMKQGKTPFVGAVESNNGISMYIDKPAIHDGMTITVSYDGSIGEAFYQPKPYWASDAVNVLYPNFEMTAEIALFFCVILRQEKYRYSYGRKWHSERMKNTILHLPTKNNLPDWEYMTSYIQHLGFDLNADLSKPLNANEVKLNVDTWKYFQFSELFDIKKGKRLTKAEMIAGKVPFIGAIDNNNGCSNYIGQKAIYPSNTLTVVYNGNGVADTFYQTEDFWASDDVNILYPKFENNSFISLFLCAIIKQEKYRFSYGRKWTLEKMKTSAIKLPVTTKGTPDFEFMEKYIKSLPYSSQL